MNESQVDKILDKLERIAHFLELMAESEARNSGVIEEMAEVQRRMATKIEPIDINSPKSMAIRRACLHNNFKWPEDMTSGVMFYEGHNITFEEFNLFSTMGEKNGNPREDIRKY